MLFGKKTNAHVKEAKEMSKIADAFIKIETAVHEAVFSKTKSRTFQHACAGLFVLFWQCESHYISAVCFKLFGNIGFAP